jgi:hypothetical protein
MEMSFSVAVSAPRKGVFRHWEMFSFPSGLSHHLGLLCGLDPAPFVGWVCPAGVAIRQPKLVRSAVFCVTGAAETQRFRFADGGRDSSPMDAIIVELIVRDR